MSQGFKIMRWMCGYVYINFNLKQTESGIHIYNKKQFKMHTRKLIGMKNQFLVGNPFI